VVHKWGGFWTEKSLVIFGRNTAWKINKTLREEQVGETIEVFSHYEEQNACNSGIGTRRASVSEWFGARVGEQGQPEDYQRRGRGRVNVMGGIREQDRKRVCFSSRGNADTFYEQVQQLHEFVRMNGLLRKFSWTVPTNRTEDCACLDNASYHKQLDIREQIVKELPNVVLEFLPAVLISIWLLVWHSCRYIAHRLFKSVNELRDLLEKLLNQGELIIKCGSVGWKKR